MTSWTIFHIDGERTLRGGERQLLYLACALRARGHSNIIACRGGSLLDASARRLGLETLHLPFLWEWDPLSAWLLRRAAAAARRPVLHAHTAHAAALIRLSGARFPRVVHRRVDFALSGGLSRALKYDSADRVVAVSRAIRDILVRDGLDPSRVDVVPDAIPVGSEECGWVAADPRRFAPPSPEERRRCRDVLAAAWGLPREAPWVGNLAALVPHKDHDTLLGAAYLVLKNHPEARFLIAGEGPLQAALLRQIERLDLLGRVVLLGQVDDPVPVLKSLDMLAHSSWGEGMGSVLLEAAACGLPVAATSAGGVPEVLEDKVSGLLCAPRDPEGLAAAIGRLISEPGLRSELGGAAQARCENFRLARMAERTEGVYERVAGAL